MFCDALDSKSGPGIWAVGCTSGWLVWSQGPGELPHHPRNLGSVDATLMNPLPWKNKRENVLFIYFLY